MPHRKAQGLKRMCSSKVLPIFSRNRSIEQTVHKGALWCDAHALSHVDNTA